MLASQRSSQNTGVAIARGQPAGVQLVSPNFDGTALSFSGFNQATLSVNVGTINDRTDQQRSSTLERSISSFLADASGVPCRLLAAGSWCA